VRAGSHLRNLRPGIAAAVVAALGIASCGGSRQDAHEPSGHFKVAVHGAFPSQQKLAKRSRMVITVKNVDHRTLPNVSVTVRSFNRNSTQANLADPSRPVFVVNTGPRGGETANQDTSALGPLAPGKTATFVWKVTAVQAGPYKIRYQVSAGLYGKAIAVDAAGNQSPGGLFHGTISNAAPHSTVNFKNGKTVEGG
jgi:hypothetical protein